jgi:predicted ATP-dependent endonuclease of OLD family
MRFSHFGFKNFKGINDLVLNLSESPNSNIYALVGLNESGKTTILEAIGAYKSEEMPMTKETKAPLTDANKFIPLGKRANFNEKILIKARLLLDSDDNKKINDFAVRETTYKEVVKLEKIIHTYEYSFKNSKSEKLQTTLTSIMGIRKEDNNKKEVSIYEDDKDSWNKITGFIREQIPDILYFPNFFFDFPSKLYLVDPGIYSKIQVLGYIEGNKQEENEYKFYRDLIQDILNSMGDNYTVEDHIIERLKSDDQNDKKNLDRTLQLMEDKVTKVILDSWNDIFRNKIQNSKIEIKAYLDSRENPYLEFSIKSDDGIYNINERSLGFRWFFSFLLFTNFRPYRKTSSKGLLYLFDEPASNLHPSAQQELLKSFKKLCENKNVTIIYTTHSHYLIDPSNLENTFVVINRTLESGNGITNSPKSTDIKVERYRKFMSSKSPTTYYAQPILDVLDYRPSNLEFIPKSVFLEGKNDYYTLTYFNEVIFGNLVDLKFVPGIGASHLDTLISLYIGWGRNFIVLLDADAEGHKQKNRYLENFGEIVSQRIFTLGDIDREWDGKNMENIINTKEKLLFQNTSFPQSDVFEKSLFNKTIQEFLINQRNFDWSEETKENFKKILCFLNNQLENVD